MYVGKLAESAEATPLYTHPKHPYTEALMSAVPIHNPRLRDKKRRIRLEGDVADPSNPPTGCYFHPRCRYVQDICKVEAPPLYPIKTITQGEDSGDHFAACHFAEELNLRGVISEGHIAAETNQEA
jgi:peptide/nickel transport system ATP-binding protein